MNVLVQKAIGVIKSKARNRRKQMEKWRDTEGKKTLQGKNSSYYNDNRQRIISASTEWNKNNREQRNVRLRCWANNYVKERRRNDPAFHLRTKLRSRMYSMLQRKSEKKVADTSTLLGCSHTELHAHLVQQLADSDDYETCQVDHIFPLDCYDLSNEVNHAKSCNFTNLQPLTADENQNKSNCLPTKDMAAKVDPSCWPVGITMDMLPDIYEGWETPLRMKAVEPK